MSKLEQQISIVMPVKNAGPYLTPCLLSILEQSYQNWEVLAVNDHSTDESAATLAQFAKQDKRIKWFANPGDGIIPSLQKAYRESKGTFIHRMDADDLMPKQKLATLYGLLQAKGKGFLATAKVKYFADDGLKQGYQNYEAWLNQLCDEDSHWNDLYKECVLASPNWLIHRQDFEKAAAFTSERYPEDYDLVFRFYQAGLKVVSHNSVTHLWRDHVKRSSRNLKVYQDNAYFDLKWYYFNQLERDINRPLMIWGAGPKGKRLARTLNKEGVDFQWVSNNPNKHGKEIYHQVLASFEQIVTVEKPQIIVAVGQRNAQVQIVDFFNRHAYQVYRDYYFFC